VLEAHFRSLVASSTDVTVVLDARLVVRWQSPAAAREFGLSDQDVVGRPLLELVHPDDAERAATGLTAGHRAQVEVRLRNGYGAWRDTEWSVSDHRWLSAVGAIVVHVRDVSERKELERTLHRAASADQLTGLPNRRELCRAAGETAGTAVIVLLGLGGLAGLNHVRGHEVGDAVLVEAARRLRSGLARRQTPARLSGDTFAVLTPEGQLPAPVLASRLLAALAEPYLLPTTAAHLSVSAGLAELGTGIDADEALRRAEIALRRARTTGEVAWYHPSMEEVLSQRLTIERELPGAIARGELDLVYQPIVAPAGRRPVGVEALPLWRHPRLGTVEIGVFDEIGEWVLHWTCRQLAGWARDGLDIWASVPVAAGLLAAPAFVPSVVGAMQAHLVPASRLVIGVAEDADTTAVAANLGRLRALGVRTASTSLRHLGALGIDLLTVDLAVLDVAGRLGVQVVAPLGEPEPAERIEAYLTDPLR
jgi:PAS domain S-box-containing protein/diguanylate cyclase (GGDEF)-like protein